jgi:hypothetical protein
MRDPFDTGPVLRLGDAKAVAPEPEVPAPVTVSVENARPYTFGDVSLSIGGMELSPASDEAIKIEAAPFSEEDRKARRSPRFNVSIPATITVEDFAKAIEKAIDRNGVVGVTTEQIAALAGNLFHSTFPRPRPNLDLFTAAFAPAVKPEILSEPEFKARMRENHAALVAKKAEQK